MKAFFTLVYKLCNEYFLCWFEVFASRDKKVPVTVFIVGPPRSGSTLIFQTLTSCFDVSFLSNKHCWLYGAPFLWRSSIIKSLRGKSDNVRLESFYGETRGLDSPCECGRWWYRFFPSGRYEDIKKVPSQSKIEGFKKSVELLADGQLILFKNLYCSLRIESLVSAFPKAKFIIINRNFADNALSILDAREKNGSAEKWWSVPIADMPASLEILSPAEQAVKQVVDTHLTIREDLIKMQVDRKNVIGIQYEAFCKEPFDHLCVLSEFLNLEIQKTPSELNNLFTQIQTRSDFGTHALGDDVAAALLKLEQRQKCVS